MKIKYNIYLTVYRGYAEYRKSKKHCLLKMGLNAYELMLTLTNY